MKNQYKLRKFTCQGCGQTVEKRRPQSKTKYCSHECFLKHHTPHPKNGKIVECEWCGEKVYKSKYYLKKHKHHFCSPECANKYQGRNKITYTCKVCGEKFKWSPSREKINPKYCSIECRDKDPEKIKQLLEMNQIVQENHTSKLETEGYKILTNLGMEFKKQVPIHNNYIVDAFVPEKNVIIQFYGDYWHGHPHRFPVLTERQKRRKQIDLQQNKEFQNLGFRVVIIWEHDMIHNKEDIVHRLEKIFK